MIAAQIKPIELRTWSTRYRGDLLICSSARDGFGLLPEGHALCVVNLVDIRPFVPADQPLTGVEPADLDGFDGFSWILDKVQLIEPFPVKGRLSIYDVDHPITFIDPIAEDDLLGYWMSRGIIRASIA